MLLGPSKFLVNRSDTVIDTIGIRKVLTTPAELVRSEYELVRIFSLPCVDFSTTEEIPYGNARPYRQLVKECFPKIKVKELKL